jgi:phosphohistidine swiveling domain-containing protein
MADPHAGRLEPRVIPVTPEFPVRWDVPEDEHMPWQFDPMHFPNPLPRWENELWCEMANKGMSPAFAGYEMPIRARGKIFNDYNYAAMFPVVPPEEMEAQGKKAEAALGAAMASMQERWEGEWLPEIKEHLAFWDACDLAALSPEQMLAQYDATLERTMRLWHLHFEIVVPAYAAMGLFDDLYKDLFEDQGAFSAIQLLGGFDNKTLETDRALWDLSRKATDKEVRQIVTTKASSQVVAALAGSAAGQALLSALNAYLADYGQRGPSLSVYEPSLIEDPSPMIKNLQDYIGQEGGDPRERLAAQAEERETGLAKAREQLAGYPEKVRGQFEFLLQAAQVGVVLSEDHGFWIDFQSTHRVRMVMVEVGRRLAEAGVVAEASDAFHLGMAEVRDALAALPEGDLLWLVAERKADIDRHRGVQPPMQLGTDYGPPPEDPLSRAFGKFFGTPPEPSNEEGNLNGHAGSPGKIQGTAKVVGALAEAEKLQQGDILVTGTTSPAWTPLFATAGAIVTDTGGILSHCAVVAREYRIPAVVGTGAATKRISDGQVLEVDGDNGTVRIVG